MAEQADWHWGISNAGSGKLLLWLEPWADEVEVPSHSTATLRIVNASAQTTELDVEQTEEYLVIWAASGDRLEVYVDQVLQKTGSASIPVPGGFGGSTKNLLGIMFSNQPGARLGGRQSEIEPPSLWQKVKRWFDV